MVAPRNLLGIKRQDKEDVVKQRAEKMESQGLKLKR